MSKIASKIIAVVAALILGISCIITGAYLQAVSTMTADAATAINEIVKTNVINRVKYGQKFKVQAAQTGVTLTVKNPGGETVTPDSNNEIAANQVGVYEITYSSTAGDYASYTYNVECYMDYEYKLVVDGNGSAIPSYWGVKTETYNYTFTLPEATLYYLDEDEDKYYPTGRTDDPNGVNEVFVKVTAPNGSVKTYDADDLAAGVTIETVYEGKYFFTYYAKVLGGDNLFSEEYTTQVQKTFNDKIAPTLTISGVPTSSSTNAAVKLPAATVNDNYDTRVNTYVTVQHKYANTESAIDVPEVVIDLKTGYATTDENKYYEASQHTDNTAANYRRDYAYNADGSRKTTSDIMKSVKAKFDNKDFMTFYPTEEGRYNVNYWAEDSTGKWNTSAGATSNRTAENPYPITVSDTTAPVYKDINESLIPSSWGLSGVFKYDVDDAVADSDLVEVKDRSIQFPIPEIYDNNDASEDLSVTFTLTDPNSKTVMTFRNIYATEASENTRYSGSETFGESARTYYFFRYWESDTAYTVSATDGKITGGDIGDNAYSLIYYDEAAGAVTKGFFDFEMWKVTDKLGQYTATYRAADVAGNSSTRTYKISLQEVFEDRTLPSVNFDVPDYFIFRHYETEQSITDVSASDSNDARLDVQYYVVFNQDNLTQTDDDNNLDFDANLPASKIDDLKEAGNLIELDASAGTNTATLEKNGSALNFTIDDKYGDEQTVVIRDSAKPVYVAIKATDSAGNQAYFMKSVKVIDGTVEPGNNFNYAPVFGTVNDEEGKAGKEYNFGSFTINYAAGDRNNTGFELYVQRIKDNKNKDVKEAPLTNVSFETYSDNRATGTNKLHVDNIRFTPSRSGVYMVVARGFHISGISSVNVAFVTVTGSSNGNVDTSAVIGDKLNYNTTYDLPNDYTRPADWTEGGVLRSISGGRMQLMGTEFTALASTTYKFNDYVFEYDLTTDGTNGYTASGNNGDTTLTNNLIKYNYTDGKSGVYSKSVPNTSDLIAGDNDTREGSYSTSASDGTTAVFKLISNDIQDVMPTYTPLSNQTVTNTDGTTSVLGRQFVVLPNISASSVNGNATSITVKITDNDGNNVRAYGVNDKLPSGYTGSALVGNMFIFEATKDGTYTVLYTATLNNQTANVTYTISAGDVIPPVFEVGTGYVNDKLYGANDTIEASVGDRFDFASIVVSSDENSTGYTYSKVLENAEGSAIGTVTAANRKNNGSSFEFTTSGTYKVTYTVTDKVGNNSFITYTINVTSSSSSVSSDAIATLAVVLIIVGVILIAGIIIYFVRFRKRRTA